MSHPTTLSRSIKFNLINCNNVNILSQRGAHQMRLCNLVSSGAVANFAGELFRSIMGLEVNLNPQFIQGLLWDLKSPKVTQSRLKSPKIALSRLKLP